MNLTIPNMTEGYLELIDLVTHRGAKVSPRGEPTLELEDVQFTLADPTQSAPVRLGRKYSDKILAAETLQWLSGTSDLRQLDSVSRGRFSRYSDDGIRLHGAYGPRSYAGLVRAVEILSRDQSSRQAVVPIWNRVEPTVTRDLPCTLSWGFRLRDDGLHMTTTMRSNDVWTGVAYDVPAMCRIGDCVAWALGVPFARYTHQVQSLHLYCRDEEAASLLDYRLDKPQPGMLTDGLDDDWRSPGTLETWHNVVWWANLALDPGCFANLPESFRWWNQQLRESVQHPYFCEMCRYRLPQPELFCP